LFRSASVLPLSSIALPTSDVDGFASTVMGNGSLLGFAPEFASAAEEPLRAKASSVAAPTAVMMRDAARERRNSIFRTAIGSYSASCACSGCRFLVVSKTSDIVLCQGIKVKSYLPAMQNHLSVRWIKDSQADSPEFLPDILSLPAERECLGAIQAPEARARSAR
jgi:hypothetical protein